MKKYALIVAGGSGVRMGSMELKQFISIAGKPLLMHTLDRFFNWDPDMVINLVLPGSQHEKWKELCTEYRFGVPHLLVSGGTTRFMSVKNGLNTIPDEGLVFIHDGVRPLVSRETLERCYHKTLAAGNAIPVIPVNESVRQVEDDVNFPVDRNRLVLIQTPQTFWVPLIKAAYRQAYTDEFTDDASVLEKTGEKIHLVQGNRENIKITWPEDLLFVKSILDPLNNQNIQ